MPGPGICEIDEWEIDIVLNLFALLLMVSAYLLAGQLGRLKPEMSTAFASFSGGVASAYVFLFILPKLASQQEILEQATSSWPLIDYLYHHAYIVAMIGFVSYYLTNMMSYVKQNDAPFDNRGKFGLYMLALYAALMGEMASLQMSVTGVSSLLLTLALFLHLLGLNYLLSNHIRKSWDWMRWLLAGSLLAGWVFGTIVTVSTATSALLSAWMAGSIIIHVVMIELPEKRKPGAFVFGVLVFLVLLKLYLNMQGLEGGI